MKVFISGGCKNGKSTYAEKIAISMKSKNTPLYYIATMIPVDNEDIVRIKRHIESRKNYNFTTCEISANIDEIINKCDNNGSFLVDSITALLSNEMFPKDKEFNLDIHKKISKDLINVFSKIDNIVIVSDYIYSDALLYDEYTETYKKSLATLDKLCATYCDVVIEVTYGNLIIYKGGEVFEKFFKGIK